MSLERLQPTHNLSILIPLDLTKDSKEFDHVQAAIRLAMGLSRMRYENCICDEVKVIIEKVKQGETYKS